MGRGPERPHDLLRDTRSHLAYNAIGSVFGLADTAAMVVVWRRVMPEQLGMLAVGLAYAID